MILIRKLFKNNKLKNKGLQYLIINVLTAFFFGLLYYLNDVFVSNNIELSKKIGILDKKYNSIKDKSNSLFYYLWFSLLTQTTLGYGGLINEKTGQSIPFGHIHYKVFKILNFMQILSIFVIAGISMN